MQPLDLVVNALVTGIDAVVLIAARRYPAWAAVIVAIGGTAAVLVAAIAGLWLADLEVFGAMRGMCWVVLVHAPVVLIGASYVAWPAHRAQAIAGIGAAVSVVLVAVDATVIEPYALEVSRYAMSSAKLAAPLRIAVISDIQSDDYGAYESDAIDRVLALRPDVILLPGDYVQIDFGDERYLEQAAKFRALAARLVAPLGVYAVQGNVDGRQTWDTDLFAGTSVQAFRETGRAEAGPIVVSALSFVDGFNVRYHVAPEDRFHIVFSHAPDFALGDGGGDLLLAGHTHGGQIVVPGFGPPVTLSKLPRAWAAGGMQRIPDGRALIVSRGIGLERGHAPRVRFDCRPELVIVDVAPR